MKILLLEDNQEKCEQIKDAVYDIISDASVFIVGNWFDYSLQINRKEFDLILLDLLVPRSPKDPKVEDHCMQLVETTRGFDSKSFRTPAIVLTKYLDQSEEFFRELNKVDINVISFDDEGMWKAALKMKVLAAKPKIKYSFLIVCALSKEVDAYAEAVDEFGPLKDISGLLCREVTIGDVRGAIIQMPRMGLVTSGIITSLAIERFEPRLLCMSGICGGIPDESFIYDILITDTCHQHDAGKWNNEGFKAEHYDVQIKSNTRNQLEELISNEAINMYLTNGLEIRKSEYPEGMDKYIANIRIVPTSSGSAVIAEEKKTAQLPGAQRKLVGFDMEVYSVYEAARLMNPELNFFAVKTVVDDGGRNKGDHFHRIGCLLSARLVVYTIKSGKLLIEK